MTNIRRALEAAAAGDSDPLYVEDVFSTYLYDGVLSGQMYIQNGIDLSGKGGLIWIKSRGAVYDNFLFSTALTSANNYLRSNTTGIEDSTSLAASFESDGFKLNSNNGMSYGGAGYGTPYVSWSFRKAEKFFDVVTYAGDSTSNRQISHSLNADIGMIAIKVLDDPNEGWPVWHKDLTDDGATAKNLYLNTTGAEDSFAQFADSADQTSTYFTLGSYGTSNNLTGKNYIAYLFASDAGGFGADEDENIIKCGIYAGSASEVSVDLGWEPQYVLIKSIVQPADWYLADSMRSMTADPYTDFLYPNLSSAEGGLSNGVMTTSTGFIADSGGGYAINHATSSYIYMAIRRPMKTPTAGTEVFAIDTAGGTAPTPPLYISGFPVDMAIFALTLSTTYDRRLHTRMLGKTSLATNSTRAEATASEGAFDYQDGWNSDSYTNATYISWMFKRAPEFMDTVCYTGTGATNNVSHGLTVIPELIIAKSRDAVQHWFVSQQITGVADWDVFYEAWDSNTAANETGSDRTSHISATTFNAAIFSNNTSTKNYIAYLFVTLAGISKVGSYTGTAASLDINMGFAAGARFFLTKRTDATGDWYVWDSARGIVAGNDPYLLMNTTAAEVTGTDYVDPLAAGITLTAAGSSTINVSGGTYIYLAIA